MLGGKMRDGHAAAVALLLVFAGLALPAVMPEVANIVTIVVSLGGMFLVGMPPLRPLLRQPGIWMPALAIMLLAVSQVASASAPSDMLALFIMAPVLLALPIAVVLRATPRPESVIHGAAMLGLAAAAVLSLYEVQYLTLGRAGMSVANPIHFADICIVLAVIGAAGALQSGRPWRWVFMGVPVLAIYSVYYSLSRGPLLAIPAIALVFGLAWIFPRMNRRHAVLLGVVLLALVAAIVVLGWNLGLLEQLPGIREIPGVFGGGEVPPGSIGERVTMYRGGLLAFLDSPWIGHGLHNIVPAAALRVDGILPAYEHLHSDLVDFGVAGGVVGLAAYGVLLAAPMAQAFASRHAPVAVVLGFAGSTAYLLMGLTNAVFGILSLTLLYAFLIAVQLRFGGVVPARS